MAQIKIAEGGSLKRFRSWIKNTFYDKTTVDGKLDAIGSVEQATSSKAGIMKLFTALGQNTDGAPTNKAVQDAVSAINTSLAGKSNTGHTHDDRYYTESEVDSKLNGKANSSHTHDDRYYTESEIDTKLDGKSNTGHTHDGRYAKGSTTEQSYSYTDSTAPRNMNLGAMNVGEIKCFKLSLTGESEEGGFSINLKTPLTGTFIVLDGVQNIVSNMAGRLVPGNTVIAYISVGEDNTSIYNYILYRVA